jgi:hypothetical protein
LDDTVDLTGAAFGDMQIFGFALREEEKRAEDARMMRY